jgi:hypothetical protein
MLNHVIVISTEAAETDYIEVIGFEISPEAPKSHFFFRAVEHRNIVTLGFQGRPQIKDAWIRGYLDVVPFANGQSQQYL